MIGGKDSIQSKSNFIPKGLIPLDKLFDQKDLAKNPKVHPNENDIQDQNIGTEDSPKIVKLSINLPPKEKKKYIDLMKNSIDVYSWSYEDLKEYDTSIIQHTIPIRSVEKPYRKKLRIINPILLPLIEKEVRKLFNVKTIVNLIFSKWVANLVPIKKKNG